MNRVYWDTMLFAYIFEANPEFGERTREAYEALLLRGDTICTSVFTIGEVLVRPKALKDPSTCSVIRTAMRSGEIELLPFTADIAEEYSNIRATTRLKAADAIHVATAIQAKADIFLTNNFEIQKQKIPGLRLIVGLDGKLF